MEETKSKWASKINWQAAVLQVIGLLAILNFIPPELEERITEIALLVIPFAIQITRSYFTTKKLA